MRNLKRALSLTLASVMLLGMMVIGTSAASYPDVTEDHNVEAIEVLKTVGAMSGSNSGNFNPDGKISRIEMAIVMANLLNLNVDYFEGQNSFSDVPDWAAKYVSACEASGIVSGVGGGRFGTGNVTATQAALMMLKALGYFQYASDFGTDWARATANQAARINLFHNINVNNNTQLTRNQVAQLALNALQSTMVDADDNTLHITTPDGTTAVGGKVNYVVRASGQDFARAIIDNRVQDASSSVTGLNGYTIELGEQLYNGDLKRVEDGIGNDFKEPAVRWTYKSREIGTYAKAADLTYTTEVKLKDIYKDLGLSNTVAANKVTFSIDGKAETACEANNPANPGDKLSTVTLTDADPGDGALKIGGKGTLTKVYYKYDNTAPAGSRDEVTITMTNYWLAQATEDYDSNNGELDVEIKSAAWSSRKTLKEENFAVIANARENDYLVLTIADGEVKSVALPNVVSNTTVSSARSEDYVYAGQKYEYNDVAKKDEDALGQEHMASASKYSLNDTEYNLYLDPWGYVLGIEAANGETNVNDYLFITAKDESRFDVIAKAVFADGTKKTITIDKFDGESVALSDITVNKFYTFKLDGDGNYELAPVKTTRSVVDGKTEKIAIQSSSASAYLDDKAQPIRDGSGNAKEIFSANANTVFVAKDKAFVGVKNAPETKTASTVYFVLDEKDRLVFVYTDAKGSNSASAEDLVYILNNNPAQTKEGNDTFYLYQAVVNGEKTTEFAANQGSRPAGLYEISTYTDGRADLKANPITDQDDYSELADYLGNVGSADYRGGTLRLGSRSYLLADGVNIRTIDGNTVSSIGPSGVKGAVEDGFVYVYVVETSSSNSDLSSVYLSKKAPAGAGSSSVPSGSNASDIADAMAGEDGQDVVTANNASLGDETLTVPAAKEVSFNGTLSGTVKTAAADGDKPAGSVILDNVTVEAGKTVDLSEAADVEFKGTTTVPAGSTLVLPADQDTLPKLTGQGTVELKGDVAVPSGDAAEILGELQAALGMEDADMGSASTADSKDTYTVQITAGTSFKSSEKSLGCYSSENLSTVVTWSGGTAGTNTVSFHQFTITDAMAKEFNTVKISYTTNGTTYTAMSEEVYGGGDDGSTLPEIPTDDPLTVILPLADNVTGIKIELSTVTD